MKCISNNHTVKINGIVNTQMINSMNLLNTLGLNPFAARVILGKLFKWGCDYSLPLKVAPMEIA